MRFVANRQGQASTDTAEKIVATIVVVVLIAIVLIVMWLAARD